MITNYTSTPPNYAINLVPMYKDIIVYMDTIDRCKICIGKTNNNELNVSETYTITRQTDGSWNISEHNTTEYTIDSISKPYYTYSNYYVGSQIPTIYYNREMGFYAKGIFILILAYIIGKTIIRLLRR